MSTMTRRTALTNDAVAKLAPSVFTDSAPLTASKRYQFVRTADVLDTLKGAGYLPVTAGQAKARTPDGVEYARHVVRLQHESHLNRSARMVGDTVPELIITNSHNRTSAFHLSAGLYRLVCANGMAVSAGEFASVRVLHNDPAIHDHIVDGTKFVRELTETVIAPSIERMQRKTLTKAQALEFAQGATLLKWGEVREDQAEALLAARREEDEGYNVWNVLNRIQENAVKGGYQTQDRRGRNIQARGITAVDRDLDFNVRLWTLGSRVLEAA